MNDKFQYWVDIAEYDLETAKAMYNTKRYLYVGFMCHQVIEKGLKAIIAKSKATMPPKSHHLIKLAELSKIWYLLSQEHQDFLYLLNPLNIEARYPSYKNDIADSLNESRCHEYLNKTEELFCWIKQQL